MALLRSLLLLLAGVCVLGLQPPVQLATARTTSSRVQPPSRRHSAVNPRLVEPPLVGDDDAPPTPVDEESATTAATEPSSTPICSTCDGSGRILGGLAAIELFAWWPIKAYRPCPECASRGVRYRRSGQTLDEIVFKKNPAGGYYGDGDD